MKKPKHCGVYRLDEALTRQTKEVSLHNAILAFDKGAYNYFCS